MNADQIRFLASKGLSALEIAEFAELMQPVRSPEAERQARYRARGGGKIDSDLRHQVFDRDGWRCLDCGAEDNLCADHVIPVSRGGETSFENLQTLCIPCNSRKKDRIRKRDTRRPRVRRSSAESPRTPPIDNHTPPVSSSEETKPVRKSRPKAQPPAKPEGVTERVWLDFNRQRKTPVTETAVEGIAAEAAKAGWTLNAALTEAVSRGWQSFKADWVTDQRPAANDGGYLAHLAAKGGP